MTAIPIRRSRQFALALTLAAVGCAHTETPEPAPPVAEIIEEIVEPVAEEPDDADTEAPAEQSLFTFDVNLLDGSPDSLSGYAGKVALVVNVASRCGYTPQYAGLQALADEFADEGLVVLAFPSNEFGGQEPGSPAEIAEFCTSKFGVTFPLFEKCEVMSGPGQSPIYTFLEEQTGSVPNWNFCKYLVGRDGQPSGFYPSNVAPSDAQLRGDIAQALR